MRCKKATAQRQRSDSAATAQRQRSDSAATAQRQRSDSTAPAAGQQRAGPVAVSVRGARKHSNTISTPHPPPVASTTRCRVRVSYVVRGRSMNVHVSSPPLADSNPAKVVPYTRPAPSTPPPLPPPLPPPPAPTAALPSAVLAELTRRPRVPVLLRRWGDTEGAQTKACSEWQADVRASGQPASAGTSNPSHTPHLFPHSPPPLPHAANHAAAPQRHSAPQSCPPSALTPCPACPRGRWQQRVRPAPPALAGCCVAPLPPAPACAPWRSPCT
jgi:hypothetical protein